MYDREKTIQDAHNQGQKDGAAGKSNAPYDSGWELSNMISFGLRGCVEGVSAEDRATINEAYWAGVDNGNKQR